jgi:hypothetical protein
VKIYSKGPLTMESPEGQIFPGVAGTTYSGKAIVNDERTGFTLKIGTNEFHFQRR